MVTRARFERATPSFGEFLDGFATIGLIVWNRSDIRWDQLAS